MAGIPGKRIPDEVRTPPVPSGLINRTSNRLMKIIKNITIEPALLMISFCSSMESIAGKFHHSDSSYVWISIKNPDASLDFFWFHFFNECFFHFYYAKKSIFFCVVKMEKYLSKKKKIQKNIQIFFWIFLDVLGKYVPIVF